MNFRPLIGLSAALLALFLGGCAMTSTNMDSSYFNEQKQQRIVDHLESIVGDKVGGVVSSDDFHHYFFAEGGHVTLLFPELLIKRVVREDSDFAVEIQQMHQLSQKFKHVTPVLQEYDGMIDGAYVKFSRLLEIGDTLFEVSADWEMIETPWVEVGLCPSIVYKVDLPHNRLDNQIVDFVLQVEGSEDGYLTFDAHNLGGQELPVMMIPGRTDVILMGRDRFIGYDAQAKTFTLDQGWGDATIVDVQIHNNVIIVENDGVQSVVHLERTRKNPCEGFWVEEV